MLTKTALKTIALAGQPNTGKSTVFNRLTGARQHVGNWPGKTIEQKIGSFSFNEADYNLVDLPGTYSLTANSAEEKIARDFLINDKPDVVIVLADASQLERTLYLLTEVRLLPVPVILALNMMDVAEEQGKNIDVTAMEKELGVPVVPMKAAKGEGFEELLERVKKINLNEKTPSAPVMDECSEYNQLFSLLDGNLPEGISAEWITVKLIEKDPEVTEFVKDNLKGEIIEQLDSMLDKVENGALIIAGLRYKWIGNVLNASMKKIGEKQKEGRGRRFDRAATHPVLGKVIAVFVMILSFAAAMIVASPLMALFQPLSTGLAAVILESSAFPPLLASLLAEGLLPGITVSLMMLAFFAAMCLVFGLIEDIGYFSRMAYVFDRPMNRIGLHGKSFMPLLLSFGCNIAGVMGTRVIDSWRQRIVTMIIVSIVPCMALWGVVGFVGTIFFGATMPIIILALLIIMVLHLSLTSFLLRRFVVRGKASGLIMELPPYHKPNWKTIFSYVFVQIKSFLKRAFTLIVIVSALIWALSYRSDGNMELSVLARFGQFFNPLTNFLGLDWRLFIAILSAMVAKEASLSVLAILYGLGGGSSITGLIMSTAGVERSMLAGALSSAVSPASALAFIFTFFFTVPCIGTVATIYAETKSLKWTLGSTFYYIISSLIAGGLAYRVGLLIFGG